MDYLAPSVLLVLLASAVLPVLPDQRAYLVPLDTTASLALKASAANRALQAPSACRDQQEATEPTGLPVLAVPLDLLVLLAAMVLLVLKAGQVSQAPPALQALPVLPAFPRLLSFLRCLLARASSPAWCDRRSMASQSPALWWNSPGTALSGPPFYQAQQAIFASALFPPKRSSSHPAPLDKKRLRRPSLSPAANPATTPWPSPPPCSPARRASWSRGTRFLATLTHIWILLMAATCKSRGHFTIAIVSLLLHATFTRQPSTPLIDGPRFFGNRACPGVSLSADITSGWGPETMLLSSPPPGVYTFKVRQYSAAGSLRHVHLPLLHPVSPYVCLSESGAIVSFYGATPQPLVFRPTSHGTIQGVSCSAHGPS